MEPAGHLRIWVDWRDEARTQGSLHWDWLPLASAGGVPMNASAPLSREVTADGLRQAARSLRNDWDWACEMAVCNVPDAAAIRRLLERTATRLARDLLPTSGKPDLASLAPEDSVLLVTLSPDWIPIEIFNAAGPGQGYVPMGMRFQLLHTHWDRLDGKTGKSGRQPFDQDVDACLAFCAEHMQADRDGRHRTQLEDGLAELYPDGRIRLHASPNLNRHKLQELAADRAVAFLYFFGHGHAETAGLCVHDGDVSAKEFEAAFRSSKQRPRGLAFLNACWSAASACCEADSLARVFWDAGWLSVLGTVLPPLDVQAADAAERFVLSLRAGQTIAEAFWDVRKGAWRRFRDGEPTLAWAVYRLYGDPDRLHLPTPFNTAEGDWLLAAGGRFVVLPASVLSEREQQRLMQALHAAEHDALRALWALAHSDELVAQVALFKALPYLTDIVMDADALDELERLEKDRPSASQSDSGEGPWTDLGDSQSRQIARDRVLFGAFRGTPRGERISASSLSREWRQFHASIAILGRLPLSSKPGRPERSLDSWREEWSLPADLVEVIEIAEFLTDRNGASCIEPQALFMAVLVHLAGEAVSAKAPSQAYVNLSQSDRGERPLYLAHISKPSQVLLDRAATACLSTRALDPPFWCFLLRELLQDDTLHSSHDEALATLAALATSMSKRLVDVAVPRLFDVSVAVGATGPRRLPSTALGLWGEDLAKAAEYFGRRSPLLVAPIPGRPGGLFDALVKHLLELVESDASSEGAGRLDPAVPQVHLRAQDLLATLRPGGVLALLGGLRRRGGPPDREALDQLLGKAVLCVHQFEGWHEKCGQVGRAASMLIEHVRTRAPVVFFANEHELALDDARAIGETHRIPVISLTPPTGERLCKLLVEWCGQEVGEKVEETVRKVMKESGEREHLSRCLEILDRDVPEAPHRRGP